MIKYIINVNKLLSVQQSNIPIISTLFRNKKRKTIHSLTVIFFILIGQKQVFCDCLTSVKAYSLDNPVEKHTKILSSM